VIEEHDMLVGEVKIRASDNAPIASVIIPDGTAAITFPQTIAPGEDLLLTRREVATMLRVSQGYLRHMGARLLPVVKIGGAVRYRLSDVLVLIERRTVDASQGGGGEPGGYPGE
jgi:hypothetical protein